MKYNKEQHLKRSQLILHWLVAVVLVIPYLIYNLILMPLIRYFKNLIAEQGARIEYKK